MTKDCKKKKQTYEIKLKYVYNHRPQLINKLTHFIHQKAIIGNFRTRSSRAGLKASFTIVVMFCFLISFSFYFYDYARL